MKMYRLMMLLVAVAVLAVTGCKQSGGGSVDTASLESSFASADAAAKSGVDKAVAAIKSADYAGALAELKSLGDKVKLTLEQERAVKDVMAQLEKMIASLTQQAGEAASKAADDAGKAVGDLQKSLKK